MYILFSALTPSSFTICLSAYLSLVSFGLNRSQMVEWESISMLLLLVNSTESLSLYLYAYVCHVCFNVMRSFLLHLFPVLFSSPYFFSLSFSVDNVVMHSPLPSLPFSLYSSCLLSLVSVRDRTAIIIIREICKFDDRLRNSIRESNMRTFNRLSMNNISDISE